MLTFKDFKEKIGPTEMSVEQLEKLRISLYAIITPIINNFVSKKFKKKLLSNIKPSSRGEFPHKV